MLNSFKTFTASLNLSFSVDHNSLRGREYHDLYWSCVSAGVESLLMNTPAPHELSLRKPMGSGQRPERGRLHAQRIRVMVDEHFWRELWDDLLLPSQQARDVFVESLRARRDESAAETLPSLLDRGRVTPALLVLTAYLEHIGREGRPPAYHLVSEDLEVFMGACGYHHGEIYKTIMRWLEGSEGSEGANALRGVYHCYWRSLRRALIEESPETDHVRDVLIEQPLDLFLGRPVVMPVASSDGATAVASESHSLLPESKLQKRRLPRRDASDTLEMLSQSAPLSPTTERFDQRELLNELNRLRDENDRLSELRFDQILMSMLSPALSHQAPLDEWARSAEVSPLDALLLREIKSVLLRGQLRIVGEIGEELSVELPHRHYKLEHTRLPKQRQGEHRYRIVKRGIELGGSVVVPIILKPLEDCV